MFAGAAREVVFANPKVVRRINKDFVPVALKAALVNNPPRGVEGALYAEIGRSKPAPQGICTVNSAGKVLTWALSFDDEPSILKFLDHVEKRYAQAPDGKKPVVAERYRKFPSLKLPNVADNGKSIDIPESHARGTRCPAKPAVEKGTLVGRIVGRVLDKSGKPIEDTLRQEHYMEARFEIPVVAQNQFVAATNEQGKEKFTVPDAFVKALLEPAYLGQLDVNPLGTIPGSRNDWSAWEFVAREVPADGKRFVRLRIEGHSLISGSQGSRGVPKSDGRHWQHRVILRWEGYVDIADGTITRVVMVAHGSERLRWGNLNLLRTREKPVEHLMAGHAIDLDSRVKYGLVAGPAPADEVVEAK